MNLLVNKRFLRDALKKITPIATHRFKTEYSLIDIIVLEARDNVLYLHCSNGFLYARCEITNAKDSSLQIIDTGKVKCTATVLRDIISAIGGRNRDDCIIEIKVNKEDSNTLSIRKFDSNNNEKVAVIPIIEFEQDLQEIASYDIDDFKGDSYLFESDLFIRGAQSVIKYGDHKEYERQMYNGMLCLHLLPTETRFVCGNGRFFGIFSWHKTILENQAEKSLVLPITQLSLALPLLENSFQLQIGYKHGQECLLKPDNEYVLLIRGLPDIEYPPYYNYVFTQKDAQATFWFSTPDICETADLFRACADRDRDKYLVYYFSIDVTKNKDIAVFEVKENRYKCKQNINCISYFKNDLSEYRDFIACEHLYNISSIADSDFIMFLVKAAKSPFMVEFGVLEAENKDSHNDNVPTFKQKDENTSFRLLVCPVRSVG